MRGAGTLVGAADRRVHTRLREIFEDAMICVRPFFERRSLWSHVPLAHLAYHVVRERYPDLSFGEIYVLLTAAARVYGEGAEARR